MMATTNGHRTNNQPAAQPVDDVEMMTAAAARCIAAGNNLQLPTTADYDARCEFGLLLTDALEHGRLFTPERVRLLLPLLQQIQREITLNYQGDMAFAEALTPTLEKHNTTDSYTLDMVRASLGYL